MAKKSERDVRKELETRLAEIAYLEEQARQEGLAFASLSEDQLVKKIRGETSATPYIYTASWVSGASMGSSVFYRVTVANPDPNPYAFVVVTIFFGLGNFYDDIAEGVNGRDANWPYVSSGPSLKSRLDRGSLKGLVRSRLNAAEAQGPA